MNFWVSILILTTTLVNVSTHGHEYIDDMDSSFSQYTSTNLPSDGVRDASIRSNDLSSCDSRAGGTSSVHNCHLGHCSFVLPIRLRVEPQANSAHHVSLHEQISTVDLFLKRKPPKV